MFLIIKNLLSNLNQQIILQKIAHIILYKKFEIVDIVIFSLASRRDIFKCFKDA